ncbi:hypothetical protein PIB30_030822 [Stylosanthes scabra]|uniref:Uncharacterized protein n=1 Tax=Stylosanthes scabra TaxID=79078 RepID=A0ABU6SD88_9FABA|nr:hypothetical protein [Stylosanthes scabra]
MTRGSLIKRSHRLSPTGALFLIYGNAFHHHHHPLTRHPPTLSRRSAVPQPVHLSYHRCRRSSRAPWKKSQPLSSQRRHPATPHLIPLSSSSPSPLVQRRRSVVALEASAVSSYPSPGSPSSSSKKSSSRRVRFPSPSSSLRLSLPWSSGVVGNMAVFVAKTQTYTSI